jgi:hypothetical protein
MKKVALSVALVAALAACGDAESREDLESEALTEEGEPVGRAVPAEPTRAIEAGTVLTFEVRENVSTSSHAEGTTFSLVLVDAATGPGGALLPAGTPAQGVVTAAHASTGPNDEAVLAVRVASVDVGGSQKPIEGEVQSTEIESSTRESGARTAAEVATGTAAGAIVGQILGRDTRSTVTGAAVGTAVGLGVALTTRGGDATIPQGSRIVVRLDNDLEL